MATPQTSVLIAIPLLLESSMLAIHFALLSQNLLPLAKSEKTRLLSLVTTVLAIIFTASVGLVCMRIDDGMDTSKSACKATYVLCVVSWLTIKSIVCLYFYEKLQFAKGVPAQNRAVDGELYLANAIGMLLPALFVIWIVVEFHYYEPRNNLCSLGLTSFIANLYLLLHNVLLNAYVSLSFLQLPPPSLQDMFKPNPMKYAWCNIVTCAVPFMYLITLLISGGIQDAWIVVAAALLDVGIAVIVLGVLEGRSGVRPVTHAVQQGNLICEDCERCAKNGDSPWLSFFDLSLVLVDGADE